MGTEERSKLFYFFITAFYKLEILKSLTYRPVFLLLCNDS